MMMKSFIGVCCTVLLCLSACGDIDSPEFPPSKVNLNDIKELTDFSYSEQKDLESKYGIFFDYRDRRAYLLSGNPVFDSPYERCSYLEFCISPDKDNLSEEKIFYYNYDYEKVYSNTTEYWNENASIAMFHFDMMSWGAGTYYYRLVAYNWTWGGGPGILDDCLQQDGRKATFSEIKSFTIPTKYAPYADISYSEWEQMVYARFYNSEFEEGIARIGVCYSTTNQLPTTADQVFTAEIGKGEVSFPYQGGSCYMRPFVVTQDNVTVYGYVQPFQFSR